MDGTTRPRVKVKTKDLKHKTNLTAIFRRPHSRTAKYTVFPSAQKAFSDTNQMLAYKTSLNKLKKIEDMHPLCL